MVDSFKPKKSKAVAKAILNQLNQESVLIIEALAAKWPSAAAPLYFLRASFGSLLVYKQEVLNQFTEFMMKNPQVFTDEILASPEFKDGLIVFLDSYFKLRSDKKRRMAESIFYDFTQHPKKHLYPLERYDDTLEKISESAIKLLGFIDSEVPKLRIEYTKQKMYTNNNDTNDRTLEEWIKTYTSNEDLTTFINLKIDKDVKLKLDTYKGDEPLKYEGDLTTEMRNWYYIGLSELEQLGLAKHSLKGLGTWSGGGGTSAYNLTHYGNKFVSALKSSNVNASSRS